MAVVILALGIGASTAIFSVLYAATIRPLPYADSDQLVMIWRTSRQLPQLGVSGDEFLDWVKQSSVFSGLAAFRRHAPALTDAGTSDRLNGYRVTPDFFKVFKVQPVQGRLFAPGDDQPGSDHLVVLGARFQARGPGRESATMGGKLTLDREDFAVIGRVPPSFRFPALLGSETDPEAYVSWPLDRMTKGGRENTSIFAIGRLKPGITIRQAQAQMATIAARLAQQYPETNAGTGIRVVSLREELKGPWGVLYGFLLCAVGLLLLLACVNIAVLLLAQGARRQHEIAIRQAVGASRARITTQLLTESVLLALAGGAVGVLVAFWFKNAMLAFSPPLLIPKTNPISINGQVLAFALVISVATGILFGLVPALQLSRVDLQELLKEGAQAAGTGMRTLRARDILVVAEVALALSLLIACGLMVRSLAGFLLAKPGYNPRNMITARLTYPTFKYPKYEALGASLDRLLEQVKALPGVESVALQGGIGAHVATANNPLTAASLMEGPFVLVNQVTPDYFRTMQIPLLRGRTFNSAEYNEKPSVMIVSSSLAHSLWPNQEALGKRLTTTYPAEWNEVVGVAADAPSLGGTLPFPQAYSPKFNTYMNLLVRTSGNPKGSMTPIRTLILAQDKDTGVASMMTMEESLAEQNGPLRYTAGVLGTMAIIALLLATIGVYAVTAYSVSQRSHEFGIRMALGAQRGKVLMLVMRQGIRLSLLGIVIGLLITLALGRVLAFFLHGVAVGDVSTYLVVSLLFLLVTLLASYLPSRRATRIDPAAALRCE